jgi:hypothetical protein
MALNLEVVLPESPKKSTLSDILSMLRVLNNFRTTRSRHKVLVDDRQQVNTEKSNGHVAFG